MNVYWGLNSIPELQGLPKPQQQRLWRMGVRAGWRMPRVWGGYLLMLLSMSIGNFGPILLPGFFSGLLPIILWGAFWGGLGGVVPSQVTIRAVRPVLARHRQAMEPKPSRDGSYYVPPAF